MTLVQLYVTVGGSLDEVTQRIPGKLVLKFVKMYAADGSFAALTTALAAEDWQTAFRAAHTLKGVAQNLDFGDLGRSAAALTEALRGTKPLEDYSLYESVVQAQAALTNAISALENG